MDRNQISEAARAKIAGNPDLEAAMRAEWAKVEKCIADHAASSKKRWKVYEVHHLNQAARLEMLTEFVHGRSPAECAAAALCRAGIEVDG